MPIEESWFLPGPASESRDQQRVKEVRALKAQDGLPCQYEAGKKILE